MSLNAVHEEYPFSTRTLLSLMFFFVRIIILKTHGKVLSTFWDQLEISFAS